MLKLTFVHALCLLALGVLGALKASNAPELRAFAVPGLFFGGATLFAAFFALRERSHGMAAAAFLSFIAEGRQTGEGRCPTPTPTNNRSFARAGRSRTDRSLVD